MFTLNKTLVTKFSLSPSTDEEDLNDYIFETATSCDNSLRAASSSDHSVIVISPTFDILGRLNYHKDTIQNILFSSVSPPIIYSASSDKSVCIWDIRAPTAPQAILNMHEEVPAISVGLGENLLAVACESTIHFFDVRALDRKLGVYADCHTDEITQLKFHPKNPSVLTSGGEDGLICVFDTSVSAKDEAVVSILNSECPGSSKSNTLIIINSSDSTNPQHIYLRPVRKLGYFGDGSEGVYCLSSVETGTVNLF